MNTAVMLASWGAVWFCAYRLLHTRSIGYGLAWVLAGIGFLMLAAISLHNIKVGQV